MSNYVKLTDFAAKDALSSGTPAKVVKGTEIGAELDAIAVAVATKVEAANGTHTGTTTIATAAVTTGNIGTANVSTAMNSNGTTAIAGTLALTGVISPSQITSNQNDYAPASLSTASTIRITTDASRDITGLTGGAAGRIITLHNVGTQSAVLKDESASSTAANRFALSADYTLAADQSVVLAYDSTSSRWRLFGQNSSSSSSSSTVRTQWRTSFAAFNTSLTSAVAGWIGDGGFYQVNANVNSYTAASHYVEFTANGSVRPDTGLYYNLAGTPTFGTAFKASADPTVVVRVCPVGASATDRFWGLSGAQITTGAPTNGIYFRANTSGNYVFVCRASGTESTVDTGTAATAGTLVNLSFVSSSNGTSIQAYVNGVAAGSPITTNIPSAALGFSATFSTTTNAIGYRLADVFIEQDME